MLGKTLILGLISAGAAGAVVYYGTAPAETDALETGVLETGAPKAAQAEIINPELAKTENRITPRLPTVRTVELKDTREKLASSEWMDSEELKAKAGTMDAATDAATDEPADAAPKKQTRWLDQYLKNNKTEPETPKTPKTPEAPETPETIEKVASPNAEAPKTAPAKTVPAKTVPAKTAPAKTESQSYFRIEDGKLVEIGSEGEGAKAVVEREVKPANPPHGDKHKRGKHKQRKHEQGEKKPSHGSASQGPSSHGSASQGSASHGSANDYANKPAAAPAQGSAYAEGMDGDKRVTSAHKIKPAPVQKIELASDSTPIIATVMKEAAEIKKSELRDQAYFEITEYALSEGRFESARAAHDLIEQDELAYTAKSRIAVAHAHNGEPTKAFKTINEVKEEELRDFMRLQVIEALIAPQKLPESWQKQN